MRNQSIRVKATTTCHNRRHTPFQALAFLLLQIDCQKDRVHSSESRRFRFVERYSCHIGGGRSGVRQQIYDFPHRRMRRHSCGFDCHCRRDQDNPRRHQSASRTVSGQGTGKMVQNHSCKGISDHVYYPITALSSFCQHTPVDRNGDLLRVHDTLSREVEVQINASRLSALRPLTSRIRRSKCVQEPRRRQLNSHKFQTTIQLTRKTEKRPQLSISHRAITPST